MIIAVNDVVIIEGGLQHVGELHVWPVWFRHDLLWLNDVIETASTVTLHPDPATSSSVKRIIMAGMPRDWSFPWPYHRAGPQEQLILSGKGWCEGVEPYIIIELRRDLWYDKIHPSAIL